MLPPGASIIIVQVLGNVREDDVCTAPRHYELQGVSYSLPATLLRGGGGFMKVINTGTKDIEWEAGQILARADSCNESAIQSSRVSLAKTLKIVQSQRRSAICAAHSIVQRVCAQAQVHSLFRHDHNPMGR